jgi:hypothetical protein
MAKRTKVHASTTASIRKQLATMPVEDRAEFLLMMFSVIVSEFAVMFLEHTRPDRRKVLEKNYDTMVMGIMPRRRKAK